MKALTFLLSTLILVVVGCTFPVEKETVVEKQPPVIHEQRDVVVEQPVIPLHGCSYLGTAFADGVLSCQSGLEYRCEDGVWVSRDFGC
jgi:hypothetical protein